MAQSKRENYNSRIQKQIFQIDVEATKRIKKLLEEVLLDPELPLMTRKWIDQSFLCYNLFKSMQDRNSLRDDFTKTTHCFWQLEEHWPEAFKIAEEANFEMDRLYTTYWKPGETFQLSKLETVEDCNNARATIQDLYVSDCISKNQWNQLSKLIKITSARLIPNPTVACLM